MDTKWNSTDKGPEEALEQFAADQVLDADRVIQVNKTPGRWRPVKAVAGSLAFFLGISLVLGSLGAAAGRWAWERGGGEWWKSDWQETDAFRSEVAAYLKEFLTLAAGGDLDWYTTEVVPGALQEAIYDGTTIWCTTVTGTPRTSDEIASGYSRYKNDKNVLYRVREQGSAYSPSEWYSNTDGTELSRNLPEGYNFLLTFANGKVTILKDGAELDVYGDGIYDDNSAWFVPGYENFPAGAGVENVTVYMAVRETPARYYTGDYANGGYTQSSRMYYVWQSIRESRAFFIRQAALFGAGLLCLALWFLLRREKRLADKRLAAWTVHIWTELRFVAAAGSLACLLPRVGSAARDLWWEIWYSGSFSYALPYIGRALIASLENTAALLALVWAVWLIHNDHKYNPKERRRGLFRAVFRALRARELKRPVQKRLARSSMIALAALAIHLLSLLLIIYYLLQPILMGRITAPRRTLVSIAGLVYVLLLAWLIYSIWRSRRLPHDIGLLADQVEAIRNGDLSTPLDLPEDADLRQTAEALNDIQAGLHKALEEQTRSERMKVELISNVSHDLKTPLTSILSYAELLRQEPLEGAAADYARIIDEKAHRLSAMVQDVFEVSKAAASQLPVHLERLDLGKLLRQTLADMDDPIRASKLTFKLDLPEKPVTIVADGKRLYRVFQNLIQNALQYALEGSRVYLSLKTGAGRAEASLRNTSRSELPEGVDFTARFVRGDKSRTDGGSGLGLSIASSFTEACGGEFRVETVADLFTAVVTFPLAEG